MKQNTRGFASILLILGAVAFFALGVFAYYRYSENDQTGGASIQTQVTDTIGTLRTNTNTNFSNIDSEIAAITSTQSTYGNLVTLNSPLPVANGGTGLSTGPSNAQFLSASGTSPAWKALIFGGGLVSTTTATSVQINTAGFDPTQNIAFTGTNTHAGSETFNGTTTINGTTTLNGLTTFASLPTEPTTTPTSSGQITSKAYIDAVTPLFISSSATSGVLSITNTLLSPIATSTFSLANSGKVLINVAGVAADNTNSDGCGVTVAVNGTNQGTLSNPYMTEDANPSSLNGVNQNISFSFLTPSALSAGTNTINLDLYGVGTSICTYAIEQFAVEFIAK